MLVALLMGFVLYSVSNHKDQLSVDNFRYMLKFINFSESETGPKTEIFIDSDQTNQYRLLRGDVGVLNIDGLTVYDTNGSKILQSSFKFDSPKMISNPKNIIVCDIGGHNLKVFNPYSTVYTETFDYPVFDIATSESGGLIVASASKGYKSAFYIYDEFFRVIYSYNFGDRYIDSVALSKDGKEALTLLHNSEAGSIATRILKYSVEQEKAVFEAVYKDEHPYKVAYMSDGYYALFTDKSLRFFSPDNQVIRQIMFREKSLLSYEFTSDYVIITYTPQGLLSRTELYLYNKDETLDEVFLFDGAVLDMYVSDSFLYTLSHGLITVTDTRDKDNIKVLEVDNDTTGFLIDGDNLVLLSPSRVNFPGDIVSDLRQKADTSD